MGRRAEPKPRHVTVVRYHDAQGRRCSKDTPGAVKKKEKSESYYVELPRGKGQPKERVALETTDLAVAWKRLRDILEQRHREALGLVDETTRQAARPIAEHVEEWLAAVAAGQVEARRIDMLRSRITLLIELAGWQRIADIRKASCQMGLSKLQAAGGPCRGRGSAGKDKGASDQTRNHYLSHARQFARWLHDEGRLPTDPLAGTKGVSVDADRRHDRRAPGDEEVTVLFGYLAGGYLEQQPPVRREMTGPQRALGYEVAMCTGLRAGELRSLTRERIDLEAGEVRLGARAAKNRKRARQTLPSWLCDKLQKWFAAGGGLWDQFPADFPGELLQLDLAGARVAWIEAADGEERQRREKSDVCRYEISTPDGPLYWDFHALRHWYISALAGQDGIPPAVLVALARHSDPRLTLDTYAKARRIDVKEAADQIRMPGQPPEE